MPVATPPPPKPKQKPKTETGGGRIGTSWPSWPILCLTFRRLRPPPDAPAAEPQVAPRRCLLNQRRPSPDRRRRRADAAKENQSWLHGFLGEQKFEVGPWCCNSIRRCRYKLRVVGRGRNRGLDSIRHALPVNPEGQITAEGLRPDKSSRNAAIRTSAARRFDHAKGAAYPDKESQCRSKVHP